MGLSWSPGGPSVSPDGPSVVEPSGRRGTFDRFPVGYVRFLGFWLGGLTCGSLSISGIDAARLLTCLWSRFGYPGVADLHSTGRTDQQSTIPRTSGSISVTRSPVVFYSSARVPESVGTPGATRRCARASSCPRNRLVGVRTGRLR